MPRIPVHIHIHAPTADAWEESKHPRDPDGKFGSGGGAGSAKHHNERAAHHAAEALKEKQYSAVHAKEVAPIREAAARAHREAAAALAAGKQAAAAKAMKEAKEAEASIEKWYNERMLAGIRANREAGRSSVFKKT